MATGKRSSTRTAAKKAVKVPARAQVLRAAGGGLVIHGRAKPDRQVLKDLGQSVTRAERTASKLREVIAGRG
jgi:hypothetical protein